MFKQDAVLFTELKPENSLNSLFICLSDSSVLMSCSDNPQQSAVPEDGMSHKNGPGADLKDESESENMKLYVSTTVLCCVITTVPSWQTG